MIVFDNVTKSYSSNVGIENVSVHIAKGDFFNFSRDVHNAMTVFGTSSPSYLLLQSLDFCNKYISENIKSDLEQCA